MRRIVEEFYCGHCGFLTHRKVEGDTCPACGRGGANPWHEEAKCWQNLKKDELSFEKTHVTFMGSKKTNRDGIPNGCSGIVKQRRGDAILVQWERIGMTTWVNIASVQ